MLDDIIEIISKNGSDTGLFLTAFDGDTVLFSQGNRQGTSTDLAHELYNQHIQHQKNHITTLVVHIVTDVVPIDAAGLETLDLQNTGLGIYDNEDNQGAILPHTQGIETVSQALQALKHQSRLSGKAHIVAFHIYDEILKYDRKGS